MKKKTERIHQNPVTHELEVTVLDATQLAFERVIQTIDGQMIRLNAAQCETLARRLIDRISMMLPQRGSTPPETGDA